jgi:hypothetical protein
MDEWMDGLMDRWMDDWMQGLCVGPSNEEDVVWRA